MYFPQIYLNSMLVRPELTPFIALRMMRLTLAHGLSMIAPAAFVTYGILCISCNYDGDSALRFGNLSIELLERLEVKEYLPRVYAGMYSCIVPWKRPLRESLPPLLLANRVGMQTGDVEFSSMSANLYCFSAIDAGVPIDEIERVWTSFQQTMRTNRQKVLLNLSIPCMESIQFYRDDTVGMTKTESLLQHCIENKLHHTANQIRMSQMRTAYIFNDFDRADRLGRQSMKELWSMPPTFEVVSMSFYNGMAALAMAGNRKRVLSSLRRAKFVITILDCIARSCPANGLDKKFLLKAELAKVRFRDEEAFEMYCCAIALANHNRFLHIEAMANERCGRFFLDREKKSDAAPYFRKAIALYGQWGAQAKVKRLNLEMDSLYDGSF